MKERLISDASLLAHEMVKDFNNPMGSRLCLKVDLQKAFDTVNRKFVYFMFHCMRFSHKWINWIRECLASPSFSIMLNGSPNGYFKSTRGIRQRDPVSPFLFILVMEFWSITMEIAHISGDIKPFKRNDAWSLTYCLRICWFIVKVM